MENWRASVGEPDLDLWVWRVEKGSLDGSVEVFLVEIDEMGFGVDVVGWNVQAVFALVAIYYGVCGYLEET